MNTELEPGYYYWKLIAEKSTTGSKRIKLVMIPALLGKMQGLKYAMIDFQRQAGKGWKVTHQALSKEDYQERLLELEREKAVFERMISDD